MATLSHVNPSFKKNIIASMIRGSSKELSQIFVNEIFNGISNVPFYFSGKLPLTNNNYLQAGGGNNMWSGEKIR